MPGIVTIKQDNCYLCVKNIYNSKGEAEFVKGMTYLSPKDEYLVRDDNNSPEIIGAFLGSHFRQVSVLDADSDGKTV